MELDGVDDDGGEDRTLPWSARPDADTVLVKVRGNAQVAAQALTVMRDAYVRGDIDEALCVATAIQPDEADLSEVAEKKCR